uniref:Ig-like domain-containing protein n=1 Tax=Acrobeloides nanus TaxID=290746 RepID=A0A914D4W1_9BILA
MFETVNGEWDLRITPKASELKLHPTGKNFFIICEVTNVSINSHPEIQWYKNGKLMRAEEFMKIKESPSFHHKKTLFIKNSTIKDSGAYACEASLDGLHRTIKFEMNFHVPFTFGKTKSLQYAKSGRDARIFCKAQGVGIQVEWLYNGTILETCSRKYKYEDQNRTLVIPSFCSCQDNGTYTCRVQQFGSYNSINITVTAREVNL